MDMMREVRNVVWELWWQGIWCGRVVCNFAWASGNKAGGLGEDANDQPAERRWEARRLC